MEKKSRHRVYRLIGSPDTSSTSVVYWKGARDLMHASIWRFPGDPDDLLPRYDAMVAEIPPTTMRLHLCLRAADGIVLVDTCPSRDVFEAFSAGAEFRALRERHGLPDSEHLEDFPVHAAFVDGSRRVEGVLR
jgi:hypothetical protein